MKKNLLALLFLSLFLVTGCDDKESKKTQTEDGSTPTVVADDDTPSTPTTPTTPTSPTTPTTPTTPPSTGTVSSKAGKVTLWNRTSGYDCAVFLPADYSESSTKNYPLIISLHGLNGSVLNTAHTDVGGAKTGFIKQVWGTNLAKTYPAIIVAPNWAPADSNTSGLWNHSQLRQIILEATETYHVDADRVVVTGLSAGSIATQELIKNSKDLLAGAMPAAYAPVISDSCEYADLPVWVLGNTSDGYFNYTSWQSVEPKVGACSNTIHEFTLTVYQSSCGHGCWDAHWAKPEVQNWLINQHR